MATRPSKRDFGGIASASATAESTAFTSVPRSVTPRTCCLLVCQTDSVGDQRPDASNPLGIIPPSPLASLTLPANTASRALGAGHHRSILHSSARKEFESSDEKSRWRVCQRGGRVPQALHLGSLATELSRQEGPQNERRVQQFRWTAVPGQMVSRQ